ncbi:MAG: glycosyltransferase involved in cell wall biosynthesis, partial [Myxococcota bacterium]
MRIIELIPTLSVGGAERVVALLAEALSAEHDVTVVVLGSSSDSWIEVQLRAAGVAVVFLDKPPGLSPATVARLARQLQRLRPDVVHSHLHVLKYLLPAQLTWRCPVVHTLHNIAEHEAVSLDRALQQLAFRAGVAAVSIGGAVTESVERVYGRPPHAVITNGIPVTDYQAPPQAGAAIRAELSLPPSAPVFVAVGRLNPQKHHAALLTALSDPRLAALDARLIVAGEGELRPELEAQIERLGLSDRAQLLGVRSDVPALLAAADAFVISSTWEGNPLAVMEAMSAGCPVVATAVGCVPELVEEGTGLLVPPDDSAALAEAMVVLAADRTHAAAMGRAGAAAATARFDVAV